MRQKQPRSIAGTIVGVVAFCAGLAAFLVPLRHAGPYGIPGRGLAGGLACLAIAAVLLARGMPALVRGVALAASPFALFLALYGAFAELEEVVVLQAPEAELRLWIVDHDGVEWVSMARSQWFRASFTWRPGTCMMPVLDPPAPQNKSLTLRVI